MSIFRGLQPESVWHYFEEICKIPRPSRKEEKITGYLIDFAVKHTLESKIDDAGNILIKKPATKGKENLKTVVLQSHLDMVCEKNASTFHDFDKDPIVPFIDGDWVKAKGTTLGADDGIGIAAQLALLASENFEHGPIECLFTSDEETGMSGAFGLAPDFITGDILLNLDSEDEGELFIGCAGGIDTVGKIRYKTKKTEKGMIAFKVSVTGLLGGHSGDEIHKGLGNSNKILNRFLWSASRHIPLRIADFNGGNLRNAIPREAYAVIVLPNKFEKEFHQLFKDFFRYAKDELGKVDPNLKMTAETVDLPDFMLKKKSNQLLMNVIYACPHGVFAWSKDIEGLVETSTNLASVKFIEDNQIEIVTSQRSSVETAKYDICNKVESTLRLAGAQIWHSAGYPGWKPNPDSKILNITKDAYWKLFNTMPKVKAIHAGLECGLFLSKYPNMDMVSFGPTIKGAHSPDERLQIDTVKKFWNLLIEVLKNIPVKN